MFYEYEGVPIGRIYPYSLKRDNFFYVFYDADTLQVHVYWPSFFALDFPAGTPIVLYACYGNPWVCYCYSGFYDGTPGKWALPGVFKQYRGPVYVWGTTIRPYFGGADYPHTWLDGFWSVYYPEWP
jgi:hypothetical protein